MPEADFVLKVVDWTNHREELYSVRRTVFIEEQGVPETLEQDQYDAECWHVLACDRAGLAIGTGRLRKDGHIGRLAVLKTWRGRGIGKALMKHLLALARRQGYPAVELNAQIQAMDFYAKWGFRAEGEAFLEAGIPHRRMQLRLSLEPEDPV